MKVAHQVFVKMKMILIINVCKWLPLAVERMRFSIFAWIHLSIPPPRSNFGIANCISFTLIVNFFSFLLIIIIAIVILCRNIVTDGSPNVQLQERFLGKGILSGLECWTKALCFFFFFGVVYVELVCNYMMLFPFNFCRFNSKNCGSSIVHTDMFEGYYPCLYIP